MLMRSTGLGKAEVIGEIVEIRAQGDYLILEMHTQEPVQWKIRAGVSRADIRVMLKWVFKNAIIGFLLNIRGWFRVPEHPGDY